MCEKIEESVQLVMCTYLAPGPNSLKKAVWMYPGCLHPTVEAGAPGYYFKRLQKHPKTEYSTRKEFKLNVSTNSSLRMRHALTTHV
jgi:hypothetical protein